MSKLLLLLGDQLDLNHPLFSSLDTSKDHVLMAELADEARYVPHNKHKIAFIFSAMRHVAKALKDKGFTVRYFDYQSTKGRWQSFDDILRHQLAQQPYRQLLLIEPGEHRVKAMFEQWQSDLNLEIKISPASHFFFSNELLKNWFADKRQPRMEHFYRFARQRTRLLMEDNKPVGGKFNFDHDNREPWQANTSVPEPRTFAPDDISAEVLTLVEKEFADNPGDLSQFALAVTAEQAKQALEDFIEKRLPDFGRFQDALSDDNALLFHSLISAYLNVGLLNPREVCEAAIEAYYHGHAPLNAVEGFVRQILGWREYVRGFYWYQGQNYADLNALAARRALPAWFWSAKLNMRCLAKAVDASLEQAYAHHIQRLMVIGSFALLAGLDVKAVCEWYLAVYIDAFEWVELPNTLGMALHADNGRLASKPYAASGRYINKMGDHCKHCIYDVNKMTGAKACPYNALYWQFIHRHQQRFESHPRMALMVSQWRKKSDQQQQAILQWSDKLLDDLEAL
ncbi:cryptochrome/photolyase family protein [Aliiglaciecola sp. CAU 1673]|uniref:cryptochrome/photolyase family protein n=1 Tax=Aliiglaciecola sp. CAU 1673 TaxID=3032595 RepID=UPI0023DA0427|nr:cryptochrome/photolyase family protein [Aliiglaciecola sp. CAU 1673]MDF2180046.1 cryptochrome/photolyase family protein [Aliiglaciecola sp. CAU 1673]